MHSFTWIYVGFCAIYNCQCYRIKFGYFSPSAVHTKCADPITGLKVSIPLVFVSYKTIIRMHQDRKAGSVKPICTELNT